MRVKNRNRRQAKTQSRTCEWDGCMEEGHYPAPASPQMLNMRKYLCLEHVRIHNKQWNYFDGMSHEEGSLFRDDSITGHRPTWKMGVNGRSRPVGEQDLFNALFDTFGDIRYQIAEEEIIAPKIPHKEQKALQALGLEMNVTRAEIKQRYKELAKKYHPDIGGKASEERFKSVVDAYHVLKTSEWFV